MKKKNIILLAVLVAITAALLVTYFALNSAADKKAAQSEADNAENLIALADYSADDIDGIKYTVGEKSETFVIRDGVWYLEDDEKFPLKQDILTALAKSMSSLAASRTVDKNEVEDESALGFNEPKAIINVSLGDVTYEYEFGAVNSFNSQTYLKTGDAVYMIDDKITSTLKTEHADLIDIKDKFPSEAQSEPVSVTVRDADGRENIISDTDGMQKLTKIISSLMAKKDYALYGLGSEELTEQGITDDSASVTVKYKTSVSSDTGENTKIDAVFKIFFGKDADGNYVYAVQDGSMTYNVSESDLTDIFEYIDYTSPETETAETEE
ncbi:MAG: DUF4340 domain-containing protein [Clostridiales bacterium]|nr:DUF4340 domain-containing protein [Clostridiales bacterium]